MRWRACWMTTVSSSPGPTLGQTPSRLWHHRRRAQGSSVVLWKPPRSADTRNLPSMARRSILGWLVALALSAGGPAAAAGPTRVTALRVESLVNPVGIDVRQPRFSWIVESPERGTRQEAYQILVASSPDKLARGQGDLWDSGKVASAENAQIPYDG